MTPLVFATEEAMTQMLRAGDTTGSVLVTINDQAAVANRLRGQDLNVRTPEQLHDSALELATKVYGSPVRLMAAVAFAAGP